jgi:hypothetical protein
MRIKDLIDLSGLDAICYFGRTFEPKLRRMNMKASNQFKKICLVPLLTLIVPFAALSQNKPIPNKKTEIREEALKIGNRLDKNPTVNKFDLKRNEKSNSLLRLGGTGVDGGGGNLRNGPPLTQDELKKYLSNPSSLDYQASVQRVLKYLFNAAYSNYSGLLFGTENYQDKKWTSTSRSIHKKLFERNDGVTIYSVLKSAKITLQGPACIDPQTKKPNDASAEVKTGTICLSWNRLSGKLYANNFESYLIPLLAHEYSHLVGTTEAEAEVLDDLLKSEVSFEKVSKNIVDMEEKIQNYTSQMPEALNQVKAAIQSGKTSAICIRSFQLHNLQMPTDNYFWTMEGFSPFNAQEFSRVNTLWLRLLNLTKYCESMNMHEILSGIEQNDLISIDYAFGSDRSEMTILELEDKIREFYFAMDVGLSTLDSDQIKYLPIEGTISKVSNGNTQAMLKELEKIDSLLVWLKNETSVFEYPQFLLKKQK